MKGRGSPKSGLLVLPLAFSAAACIALAVTSRNLSPIAWISLPKILTGQLHNIVWAVFLFGIGCLAVTFTVTLALSITAWRRYAETANSLDSTDLPGISIVIPARNEQATILDSICSALSQEYPTFEVIVVDDGSEDGTLETIRREFRRGSWGKLTIVDKDSTGKANSLNTGIAAARYPWICTLDADTVMAPDALREIIRPALVNPAVVAVSGTLRLSNSAGGLLTRFQELEYLRAFTHRTGWACLDGLLLVSGSFGLFRKSALETLGGFPEGTITEDLDLVFRIHQLIGRPKIASAPAAVAWTQAPEDLKSLAAQRSRWITGLAECLNRHAGMVLNPRYGFAGLLAAPFLFLEAILSPLACLNLLLLAVTPAAWWFVLGAFAADLLNDWIVLAMHRKPLRFYSLSLLQNFGYRQFLHIVQTTSLISWLIGTARGWGKIRRVRLAVEGGGI